MKTTNLFIYFGVSVLACCLATADTFDRALQPTPIAGTGVEVPSALDLDAYFIQDQAAIRSLDLVGSLTVRAMKDTDLHGRLCDPVCPDKNSYWIIHVLRWGDKPQDVKTLSDPAASGSLLPVSAQNWYVFHDDKSWSKEDFASNYRVYGAKKIYLLYVHLNAQTDYRAYYDLEFSPKPPDNVQNLLSLAGLFIPANGAQAQSLKSKKPRAYWGAGHFDAISSPSDISVSVVFQPNGAPAASDTSKETSSNGTSGDADRATAPVPDPPTTLAVASVAPKKSSTTGVNVSPKIDNEGRYWWDVSVGVPIRKISQTVIDTTANTVTPKKVDKTNLFALLDLYPKPVDTKRQVFNWVPHFVGGVAIASQPLHKILLAAGVGPYFANFYAGVLLVRQPQTGAGVGLPSTVSSSFSPQFAFGISMGVKAAKNAMSRTK